LCLFALSLLVLPGLAAEPASGAMLWYNGDYDNRDALANQSSNSRRIDQVTEIFVRSAVPEPSSIVLSGPGIAGAAFFGHRRWTLPRA
jgi:hypothetical protein